VRWLLVLLAACSAGGASGTGTIVFSEPVTGHVTSYDVATGNTRLIDSGSFGELSISSDRQYFAYSGADWVVKVADREGNITALDPGGRGYPSTPTWGPNHSLTYFIDDQSGIGTVFLPTVGAAPRRLVTANFAVSADGHQIVYKQFAQPGGPSTVGDVVVENADGSGHRVLQPSVTNDDLFLFTPDQQHVLTVDTPGILDIALADGSIVQLGPGWFVEPLPHDPQSNLSPDGTELLVLANKQYFGLNLETGQRRYIADAPPYCGAVAAFVDANRIVCTAHQDTTPPGSDIGMFLESVQLAAGSSTTMLVPTPPGMNQPCSLVGVARTRAYVVAACGNATLVSFDGKTLASKTALDVVGIADDESGIVAVTRDGAVFFLSRDGELRQLTTAMSPFDMDHGSLMEPFVAYEP
jgi:hypothetical protein